MGRKIQKIKNILRGWYYVAILFDPPYAKERRKVCKTCVHCKLGVCTLCGCPIVAKPRIKDEECEAGKWPMLH